MRRRTVLRSVGAGGAGLALGGCLGAPTSGPATLTVATYGPFVDAPSSSPGPWIKEEFESRFDDVELQWFTPENELNYFIQRRNAGVTIDTDVYVGLNVDDLIRIDETLTGEGLLARLSRDDLSNADAVKSELEFDPQRRAVPFDTGYISLVYDGRTIDDPETFEALTTDEYEDALIAQNAQTSDPGRAFLLWTIRNYGEDYLDYWRRLVDNGLRITGSWSDAYGAWSEGERPMVVSYSTDQVFANEAGEDLEKHQVSFLDDQGYANPEGMAVIEGTDQPDLARQFINWMLSPRVQSEIAVRNVQFPATTHAELDEEYARYALEPPEPVTHTYEELQGNLTGWIDDWAREIAGN